MKKQSSRNIGYLYALLATAFWSVNFIIARGLSDEISPVSIAFYRWSTASLFFLPFSFRSFRRDFSIIRTHFLYICITSLLGISLFNTFIYIAGHSTTAINMSMIAITAPVFIVILSRIFLKESISFHKIMGIVIVFSGALLLITKGQPSSLLEMTPARGDLWMLLAAMIFAAYSILIKLKPAELRLFPFQLSLFIMGTLFLFPFFLQDLLIGNGSLQIFNGRILIAILYVGIFASLAAFLLWNKAIEIVGPVRTGMIYYLLPLFSSILAFLFLDEEIRLYHLFCLVLIVSGILISTFKKSSDGRSNIIL
jgi:drug/metabolite transporter (DMT)-like permease